MPEDPSYRRVLVNVSETSNREDRIARGLRDTGCEVVYTRSTDPEALAVDAVQEDVDSLVTPLEDGDMIQRLEDELTAYGVDNMELVLTCEHPGEQEPQGDYMTEDATDAIKYISRSYTWEELDQVGDTLASVLQSETSQPVDTEPETIYSVLADHYSEGRASHWTHTIVEHNDHLFEAEQS